MPAKYAFPTPSVDADVYVPVEASVSTFERLLRSESRANITALYEELVL